MVLRLNNTAKFKVLETCCAKRELCMLTEYINTAMKRATYEVFSDGTFYGEIPEFHGVYSNEKTLEACKEQLQEVLEEWIILGLRLGHSLPVIDEVG